MPSPKNVDSCSTCPRAIEKLVGNHKIDRLVLLLQDPTAETDKMYSTPSSFIA